MSIQLFDATELWDERYGSIYEVKWGEWMSSDQWSEGILNLTGSAFLFQPLFKASWTLRHAGLDAR